MVTAVSLAILVGPPLFAVGRSVTFRWRRLRRSGPATFNRLVPGPGPI
jgi:hypothetical protein